MTIHRTWRVTSAAFASALLLASCSGGDKAAQTPASEPAAEAAPEGEAAMAVPPPKIDIEAARKRAKTAMFIPAPSEFQAALKAAKVDLQIRKLVKPAAEGALEGKSKPLVALATGVRISNVVLTVEDGDKDLLIKLMKQAREGLAALSAPETLLSQIDTLTQDFEAGNLQAGELGPSLDLLASRIHEDLKKGAGEDLATLVQAGGWVQTVNLLSTSLSTAGTAGDAANLMKQPTVVAHFREFLANSAQAKAGDEAVLGVLAEMKKLQEVASKKQLDLADIKTVQAASSAILSHF